MYYSNAHENALNKKPNVSAFIITLVLQCLE